MSAKTLSDIVYDRIFPGGMIPVKCKGNLDAIDLRIMEIEILATGQILEGQGRRIVDKTISAELTRKIVELRESQNPPLMFSEIVEILGNPISKDAARDRYERHVAKAKQDTLDRTGYAAISGQGVCKFPQGETWSIEARRDTSPKVEGGDHFVESNKLIDATLRNDAAPITDSSDQFPDATKLIDGYDHSTEPPEKVASSDPTIRNCRIVEESAKVPLQEAKPEQVESPPATNKEPAKVEPEATIRESRTVRETAAPDLSDENVLRLFYSGKSIKEIAKLLDVRVPWVRGICDKDRKARSEKVATKKGLPDKPALSDVNNLILEMASKNILPHEICIVVARRFHESFTTSEMAQRIRDLQGQQA